MTTALVIFAKAPVAGRAKTRLAPALGAEGAALLALRLLDHCVHEAAAARFDEVVLCVTPDGSHPAFERLARRYGITLDDQGEGDLGERMHRAFCRVLGRHSHVLVIGTDAPALDAARLQAAVAVLHECDAVFVPALDGGYALVGLRRPAPALFADMPWSTPEVMCRSRERARECSLHWCELEPVHDIDEPADLVHLPQGWAA